MKVVIPWTSEQVTQFLVLWQRGLTDREIAEEMGGRREAITALRGRLKLAVNVVSRDKHIAMSKRANEDQQAGSAVMDRTVCFRACRRHLAELMREFEGCTTLGEAKAAYRTRCELAIPPGQPDASLTVTPLVFSSSSSPAGWM